jgi:LCP family protein required for cell wall assembly
MFVMVQGPPPTYQAQRRPSRAGGVLIGLVVMLVVAVAGAAGTLVAARGAVDQVQRVPEVSSVLSTSSGTVENFLLVGSDSRANVDPDAPDAGGIGTEADTGGTNRSDTIMVLRRDKATGSASLLSIPRDLWVDIPGRDSPSRINAAYNDGPVRLVQTVQTALGIPIHHYAEVDFNGFKSLIDAIGGVELCFLLPTRDTNTGLNVPEGGCYLFDGVQALAYARSRHYEQFENGEWREDPTSDLGRTKRQRDFVDRALNAALVEVKKNPFRAGEVIESSTGAVRVDDELDVFAAASALRPAVADGLLSYALPVRGETIDGNAVLLLADGADEVLAFFRGEGPAPAVSA